MDTADPVAIAAAEWVERTRRLSNTSVSALARGAGISRHILIARIAKEQPFDISQLAKIARFFGVTTSEITAAAEQAAA